MDLQSPLEGKKKKNLLTMLKSHASTQNIHLHLLILCKMMGSASASSSAKSTIYQALQDSRKQRLALAVKFQPMSG